MEYKRAEGEVLSPLEKEGRQKAEGEVFPPLGQEGRKAEVGVLALHFHFVPPS